MMYRLLTPAILRIQAVRFALTLCCALLLAVPAARGAQTYDFQAPASVDDAATAAIMRDLAQRIIPVYHERDQNRYLENLSALQTVGGDIDSAYESRQTLRDRRRSVESTGIVARDVVYDIYVYARLIESRDKLPFPQAIAKSYWDASSRLNDQNQFIMIHWLQGPTDAMQDALQSSFGKLRGQDSIGETDALDLVWRYFAFEAYRSISPFADLLGAEDDRRRYTTDAQVLIDGPHGTTLAAYVVRPRGAGALPTLLEVRIDSGSVNFAKECAAHGYVGVTAYAFDRDISSNDSVAYEQGGEEARAMLEWITAQSWSDGRIGMYGSGYSGFTAWAVAKHPPSSLKAIATTAAVLPGVDGPMYEGIFHNSAYHWSLKATEGDSGDDDDDVVDESRWHELDLKWYQSGASYRELGRVLGHPNPTFSRWLTHPSYDKFWRKLVPDAGEYAHLTIPALTITGPYAAHIPGDLEYFAQHHKHNPHADHKLVIGPFDDGSVQSGLAAMPGLPIDPAAQIDLRELRYQWFDHVFNGAAMPALLTNTVNYEVLGANEWRHTPSLEAMGGTVMRLYLDGSALVRRRQGSVPPADTFVQRSVNFARRAEPGEKPPAELARKDLGASPSDAVYVSEPLSESTDLSGLLSGALDFKPNKMDVDMHIMLYELLPSGFYVPLFGPAYEFRASYARDRAHRHLLKAGVRQSLAFHADRILSRKVKAGSRLVLVLGINKRPDRQINYGTGRDVSDESTADAGAPLKIRWYANSYVDLPVHK